LQDEAAKHILGCDGFAGVGWDTKPILLRASAIAECRRQRLLPSDGRPMRLNDNAVIAILLHITQAGFATIHQQRQPSGTIFSGCSACDFVDFASTGSSR